MHNVIDTHKVDPGNMYPELNMKKTFNNEQEKKKYMQEYMENLSSIKQQEYEKLMQTQNEYMQIKRTN